MSQENDDTIINVEEKLSRVEQYIEENKNSLSIIVGTIVLLVGGYFAWKYWYVAGQEEEAQNEMHMAEMYFEKDSLDKAINGDGEHMGFMAIADEYGVTPSGNLASYYLGICYLRKGEFENAIERLKEFDSDDAMVGPVATGAIGDAYMELGNYDEAGSYYLQAAEQSKNNFTSPIYLKKAGIAYEEKGKYDDAARVYEKIKNEYKDSPEGRDIDKYLERARAMSGSNS